MSERETLRWMGWSNGTVSWHRCPECGAWMKDDWPECVSQRHPAAPTPEEPE